MDTALETKKRLRRTAWGSNPRPARQKLRIIENVDADSLAISYCISMSASNDRNFQDTLPICKISFVTGSEKDEQSQLGIVPIATFCNQKVATTKKWRPDRTRTWDLRCQKRVT